MIFNAIALALLFKFGASVPEENGYWRGEEWRIVAGPRAQCCLSLTSARVVYSLHAPVSAIDNSTQEPRVSMKARNVRAIGALVRQRRLELGLDQLSLATKIGASRYWVVQMEQGKEGAEIGRVLRALEALGLSVDISVPGDELARAKKKRRAPKIPVFDIDAIVENSKRPPTFISPTSGMRKRTKQMKE
jgi:HTH-type transcriptional regulator / antitoxin HipB